MSSDCVNRIIASMLLLLFMPLLLCIALWIKLHRSDKVIYVQTRLGLAKQEFALYKFCTMHEVRDSRILTQQNDPRITPWGRALRKYRLDELPQLWNIAKGDMCWIGPRPEQTYYIHKLLRISSSFKSLYTVKPGITSLGMVKFGYAKNINEIAQRAKYDKYYLQHRSILLDIYIILQTIKVICRGDGV